MSPRAFAKSIAWLPPELPASFTRVGTGKFSSGPPAAVCGAMRAIYKAPREDRGRPGKAFALKQY